MKIIALCLTLFAANAFAATVATNALTWQSIASTTVNGNTNAVTGATAPPHQFIIQYGALGTTNTNSLRIAIQLSLDSTNWITVTNWFPVGTNAAVETFTPNLNSLTMYTRVEVQTSNTISAGVLSTRRQ